MKILIIRTYPDELNIKNYNCQELGLAKALVKKDNICDIVLYKKKNENYEEEIIVDDRKKIHIYYLKAKKFLKNVLFEKRDLKNIIENYDIVQVAEYDQIGNIQIKKIAKKMIIYHGPYSSKFTKGYNLKCKISDFIYLFNKDYKNTPCIAKSKLAEEFLRKKGFENVNTIGVGLDNARFNEKVNKSPKILELENEKKDENLRYLLYIGKIERRRNTLFLINLLHEINKTKNNVKLILIGKGESDYIEEVKKEVEKYKLNDKIIYIEKMQQEELSNIYKISDIFLLPTEYEIFGMVLLEAMYFGLPVITTYNGGSSTIIENGKNGFICSKLDKAEWKEIVCDLLNDTNKLSKISTNGKITIKEKFTWNVIVKDFLKKYERIKNEEKNEKK